MKKISIIIPAYNCEKYIITCLDSIYKQDYDSKNYEVIIIDDGSKDKTNKLIQKYIKDKNNFLLITTENHGVSHARNVGIDNSKSKYIMFVDSDDLLAEGSLEYMDKIMNNDNFDLYQFSEFTFIDKKPSMYEYQTDEEKTVKIDAKDAIEKLISGEKCNGGGIISPPWAKIYKESIIKKYNIRFNENFNMFEDGIFNIEYLECAKKIYMSNKIVYLYRRDVSTSLTRKININIMEQKKLQIEHLKEIVKRNHISNIAFKKFTFCCIRSIFALYIYHPNNKMNKLERRKIINNLLKIEYFDEVLKDLKLMKHMDNNAKIIFLLLKYKMLSLLSILYKLINIKHKFLKG